MAIRARVIYWRWMYLMATFAWNDWRNFTRASLEMKRKEGLAAAHAREVLFRRTVDFWRARLLQSNGERAQVWPLVGFLRSLHLYTTHKVVSTNPAAGTGALQNGSTLITRRAFTCHHSSLSQQTRTHARNLSPLTHSRNLSPISLHSTSNPTCTLPRTPASATITTSLPSWNSAETRKCEEHQGGVLLMLTIVPDVSVPSCGPCAHQPPANPSSSLTPLPPLRLRVSHTLSLYHVSAARLPRWQARALHDTLELASPAPFGFLHFSLSAHPHLLHAILGPLG